MAPPFGKRVVTVADGETGGETDSEAGGGSLGSELEFTGGFVAVPPPPHAGAMSATSRMAPATRLGAKILTTSPFRIDSSHGNRHRGESRFTPRST